MTAIQLRAELFREMSPLLDSEAAMEKLLKYVRKLAAKKNDPTLMTKEEFFASLDRGEEAFRQGKTHRINSVEELNNFLSSL